MECWKQGCKNKVKVLCKCTDPVSYSCKNHMYEHVQVPSIKEHRLDPLKLKIDQKNKEALVKDLQKLSKELLDIKENLIKETYKKIQELNLSLTKALKNIEKIRINQADLIRKISLIKSIPKINRNPVEKLLSLDLDSARKQLGEFGCSFNSSDFDFNKKGKIDTVEKGEIVFFNKKNSVRVNLTDFSKSEHHINILQRNIDRPYYISMCLLPDKSIFCYGNLPPTGTAFILYPDSTIKQLSDGEPSGNMGSVYRDGFIYLFGGFNSDGCTWNQAAKYELSSDKWYKICPLKESLCHVSCALNKYGIIFVGYQSSKLYSYGWDNYEEYNLGLPVNTFKVLLRAENKLFLIMSSYNIFEGDLEYPTRWDLIGSFTSWNRQAAYPVYFNHSFYFMDSEYKVYKWDMERYRLTMTEV